MVRLQQVVIIAAGRLGEERVDLLGTPAWRSAAAVRLRMVKALPSSPVSCTSTWESGVGWDPAAGVERWPAFRPTVVVRRGRRVPQRDNYRRSMLLNGGGLNQLHQKQADPVMRWRASRARQ
jgi:hypothetical protein